MKPEVAFVLEPYLPLIPRHLHRTVFDCLQYANIEWEGLHSPFYHVNDVMPHCLTTGRQRGRRMHLSTCSF